MEKTLHAILAALLGLTSTYLLWDWIYGIPNAFDHTSYPTGSIILWGAFVIATLLFTVIGPLLIAVNENLTDLISILKGYMAYTAGALIYLFTYEYADTLGNVLYTISANDFANKVYWAIAIVFFVGILYIVPLFLTFQHTLGKETVVNV